MRLDLNLMPILESLVTEGSVSRTAAKMHLTQPAISYALAKLRDQLGDELLVKGRGGMKPTARALALVGPIRAGLDLIHSAIAGTALFGPATANGQISIGTDDYSAQVILPVALQRLMREAPQLSWNVHRVGPSRGEIVDAAHSFDLILTQTEAVPSPLVRRKILSDRVVLIAPRDFPEVNSRITLKDYVKLPHMVPSRNATIPRTEIDTYLGQHGLERNVKLAVPHSMYVSMAGVLEGVFTTVPRRIALAFTAATNTRVLEIPIEMAPMDVGIVWHKKHDDSARHQWLRDTIAAIGAEIEEFDGHGGKKKTITSKTARGRRKPTATATRARSNSRK